MNLTVEQIEAIRSGAAIYLHADEVGTDCVVVRADVYDQCANTAEAPLSLDQQRYLLRHVGETAGWNDPDMDVYDQRIDGCLRSALQLP